MKKISRMSLTVLTGVMLGTLLMTGCAGSADAGKDTAETAAQSSAQAEETLQPESQAEEVGEKPRLVEDEDEDFTPDRALMKANQVQNEGDAVISPVGEDKKNEKKDYSVFIYMVGSDLEASYGYATRDMQEMTESGIDYSKNNLLIYAGGSRMWKSDIPSNQNNILDMSKDGAERVVAATAHTSDMGAPETLAAFLEYGVTYYPADHYALIFWDHGGGSVYGYGNDTLYSGDSLLLHELDDVMAASPFGEGGRAHLDWVGFDACLMSTAENAVLWSRYADYMIASEETEPGDGWCYSFMNVLNEGKETREIGMAIVDAYKAYYEAKRTPLNDPDITLAVMDLKKTSALVDSIDALTREMGTDIAKQKFPELVRSRSSTKTFGIRDGRATAYDLLDIGDLSEKMKKAYPKETAAIDKALGELIVYNADEVEGSCGLSLYFPGENRTLYEAAVANGNEDLYISEEFADFVDLYAEKWMTASDADWTLPEIEVLDDELTMQLTKEQAENLDKATYTVLLDQGDGYYRRGLCKVEVKPDKNNVLHIPKNPSLIFAASDFGQLSVPCAFAQSDTRDSAATYDSMRIFLCYGTEMTSSPYDYVTATVEETDGVFSVKSFRNENASAAAGGKNTLDLSEYVALNEYTSDMLYPTRGDDGTMLPYYQWDVRTGTFMAHLLQIDESLHFIGKKVSDLDTAAAIQVILRDINGTEHGSELCGLSQGKTDQAENKVITAGTAKGTLKFERHGKEVWLTSYSGEDTEIEIPSKVEGYPLTRIDDDAIQSAYSLRKIVIPEGVKSMGFHAVSWTSSLTELTLPSTLEEVSRAPIGSAEKLEKITVNGKSPAVCDKDGVLFTADGKKLIKYPESKGRSYTVPEGTEIIAFEAFSEADLCEIEFPETLKNIENYAFEGCRSLDTLVFPDSLERIGAGAFSEGNSFFDDKEARIIDTVKFGSELGNIGLEAFSGLPVVSFEVSEENTAYSSVNGMVTSKAGDVLVLCPEEIGGSVIVPDGVVGLTPGVFEKLPPATAFYFPDSLVRMNIKDFPYSSGDNYELVYELTIYCSEGSAAETFAVKNGLDHATIKQEDLDLKQYTNETVPALNGFYSFRVYDDHAVFTAYTGSDSSIAVPAVVKGVPVTEFGDGESPIFNKEKSLSFSAWTYEDDSAEVVNLGKYGADALVNVDIPDTVTCINNGAFADISIKIDELVLPGSLEKIGPKAFGGTYSEASVGSLVISEENPNFMTKDGVLFTKDGKTLVRFPTKAKASLKAITVEKNGRSSRYIYQIPDGCETIGRFAFANTELIDPSSAFDLTIDDFAVRFSPDVHLVDGFAFYDSNISAVEMNEGLEEIGDSAFSRMKLETQTLILPSTVTSLGDSAFDSVYRSVEDPSGGSSNLVYGFSHIELPQNLKSVGENVFASYSDSHLTCDELVIGKKLTNIAEGAFNGFYTTGFSVDAKNSACSSLDGCLLDGRGETLITVPQGRQGELKVPGSVKKIGKYAVYNCDGISDIHIGPAVTYIHPQAIYNYNSAAPVIHGVKGSEAERFAAARGYAWKEEKE